MGEADTRNGIARHNKVVARSLKAWRLDLKGQWSMRLEHTMAMKSGTCLFLSSCDGDSCNKCCVSLAAARLLRRVDADDIGSQDSWSDNDLAPNSMPRPKPVKEMLTSPRLRPYEKAPYMGYAPPLPDWMRKPRPTPKPRKPLQYPPASYVLDPSLVVAATKTTNKTTLKKPLSPYMLWQNENREMVYAMLGTKDIKLVAQKFSQLWKDLTPLDKAPFVEQAKRQKEAYQALLATEAGREALRATKTGESSRRQAKEEKIYLEQKAYCLWKMDHRPSVVRLLGTEDTHAVDAKLLDLWKVTTQLDRRPYLKTAKEAKEDYQDLPVKNEAQIEVDSQLKGIRAAIKAVGKDARLKKPQSAYMIWLNENRENIISQVGTTRTDFMSKAGELWKELRDEDKKPYEQRATEAKEAHNAYIKTSEGAAALKAYQDATGVLRAHAAEARKQKRVNAAQVKKRERVEVSEGEFMQRPRTGFADLDPKYANLPKEELEAVLDAELLSSGDELDEHGNLKSLNVVEDEIEEEEAEEDEAEDDEYRPEDDEEGQKMAKRDEEDEAKPADDEAEDAENHPEEGVPPICPQE
eukprot:gnl/MRDRNA2_/MRDRNA2_117131_c0_seq1.p1 gnl/MRDRNA2_/MRDRNA2_117131_c0~~gnl/MRDRNA2_/MRDRNA2_117131_c0_seq1.p1  ORF type:complete len:627 (-),score=152.05 gnl/MRDRNA2_/MRDRNA2_117131_c0_seq1:159-1898(-)